MKYLTLLAVCLVADAGAMGITRRLEESKCADEPGATLPGGWDCARIAEYIAGSDVHYAAAGEPSHFYDDGGTEAEEPAAAASQPEAAEQPAAAAPEPTEAEEPAEPEPTFEKSTVAEAVAIDVNADTIDYEAKWAPMEVVIALFIFVTCAFSMTRLCRAKEDQYAPVTRAISEEDLVAPEEDVERGPTLEDKRRMLD